MSTTLTSPQQATVTAFDTALDDIFANGIAGVVTGLQGYSTLTSAQKTKARNVFNAVVAGMLAAGAAPAGLTQNVLAGTVTLHFTNGILISVS